MTSIIIVRTREMLRYSEISPPQKIAIFFVEYVSGRDPSVLRQSWRTGSNVEMSALYTPGTTINAAKTVARLAHPATWKLVKPGEFSPCG